MNVAIICAQTGFADRTFANLKAPRVLPTANVATARATKMSADQRVKTMGSSVKTRAIVARTRARAACAAPLRCVCRTAARALRRSNVVQANVPAVSATFPHAASTDPHATCLLIVARKSAKAACVASATASPTAPTARSMRNVATASAISSRKRAGSSRANPTACSVSIRSSVAAERVTSRQTRVALAGAFLTDSPAWPTSNVATVSAI